MASKAAIKQDLNRSGWETTDFPSVCESCLPENPYVQMLKDDHGAECKLCTRPFTLFRWKADRTSRQKRTSICLTCARLKNCCQCCMLDLSYGLPIVVRDAALKMLAPGPEGEVNRQYYAQEHERELEDGRGDVEAYEKSDEKARELLRKLANSEPYHKRQRRLENSDEQQRRRSRSPERSTSTSLTTTATTTRRPLPFSHPRNPRPRAFPSTATLPPQPADILAPRDPHITSLFITGIEDDLPEHALRTFFSPFGTLRSLICSHRAHSAFVNYAERESAEDAARHCQGKAVIAGVPLRVQWGKPRVLDSVDEEERRRRARAGRETARAVREGERGREGGLVDRGGDGGGGGEGEAGDGVGDVLAPPPGAEGQDEAQYQSLKGDY